MWRNIMSDESLTTTIADQIRDEAEKFPRYMVTIRDVFSFSFAEAAKVTEKFGCNADLFAAFEEVKAFLEKSTLPEDERDLLIQLLCDEAEIISYSQTTRCSVIAL
jgi:hypothetical protein